MHTCHEMWSLHWIFIEKLPKHPLNKSQGLEYHQTQETEIPCYFLFPVTVFFPPKNSICFIFHKTSFQKKLLLFLALWCSFWSLISVYINIKMHYPNPSKWGLNNINSHLLSLHLSLSPSYTHTNTHTYTHTHTFTQRLLPLYIQGREKEIKN